MKKRKFIKFKETLQINKSLIERRLKHATRRRDQALKRLDGIECPSIHASFAYHYWNSRVDIFEDILEGEYE